MAEEPIIEVKGMWKRYGLPPFLPWTKRAVADHEWALRDISFSVPRGGSLGILGRNGAGKSTLLKLLAGVTPPDKGSIAVRGKIFPMIELAAGMSMELSGLENIRILGTIMGLSGKEIATIIPEVEEFSELGDWLHKPVWQYSSGMVARLAFGIAVHIRADILLVDEVLAVGDVFFQKKCQQHISDLLRNGVSLIFVSHSPSLIEKMCTDALILNNGENKFLGNSGRGLKIYLSETTNNEHIKNKKLCFEGRVNTFGTDDMRITNFFVLDKNKNIVEKIVSGEKVTFCIEYVARENITHLIVMIRIYDRMDNCVAALTHNRNDCEWITIKEGRGCLMCTVYNFLFIGIYSVTITLYSKNPLDGILNGIQIEAFVPEEKVMNAINAQCLIDNNWENIFYE